MELGQRIKKLRSEQGLSQRQLCGDFITRNMLSQIENGVSRPSMDTLVALAGRLGKPVSYFLEEDAVISPNQKLMAQARQAFAHGEFAQVRQLLSQYLGPDETFDWEKELLQAKACLELAQQALQQRRLPYAEALLEESKTYQTPYFGQELEKRRQLLLARLNPKRSHSLACDLNELLLLRAEAALEQGDDSRAAALLDAAEEPKTEKWYWLRGQAHCNQREYSQAVACFHRIEQAMGQPVYEKLESCYGAMEDYKMAYFYACKQK